MSQVPLANKGPCLQGDSALKKPERTSGDAPDGKWEGLWGTHILALSRTSRESVKGKRVTEERPMQKANCKGPGVRPAVTTAGRGLWLAGQGRAGWGWLKLRCSLSSSLPCDQPSFPASQFFLLLLLNQILAPVTIPHLLPSPSYLEPWDRP